ncbi:hypothetical protein [Shimia sp. R9_3]|uniref:hypothetical protein n=1 Tax=Shimia sp. R9_3 TaxID=2821113 RepID=UPI001ADB2803|nr:hypothetical protein [Shimia sp. R9_3]MBO9401750.1 hypothetical protein [Shimia sp. R9_3]
MEVIFYLVFAYSCVGLCATSVCFFRLFASIMSLINATNAQFDEAPVKYIATGGLWQMWRVVDDRNNAHATKRMLKNLALFILSLAATMAPLLVLAAYTEQ